MKAMYLITLLAIGTLAATPAHPAWLQKKAHEKSADTGTAERPAATITRPGLVAVDVQARRQQLEEADFLDLCDKYDAGRLPEVMHDLITTAGYPDDRYLDVSETLRSLGARCLAGHEADCATIQDYALDWARNSKLKGPQGDDDDDIFWEETLTINMRLLVPMIAALSVAEQYVPMASSDRTALDRWLKRKVDEYEHSLRDAGRYKGGKDGTRAHRAANNHAVQSSIAAMSYGAWVNDPSYFETGIEQWFITMGSMREDGSLPVETRRGARALFYDGRTITALMQLAERAAVQGIDLYGTEPNPGQSVHRAVEFFLNAMEEPEVIFKYAKANRHPGPSKNYKRQDLGSIGSTLGWVGLYMARFPDHPNTQRLLPRLEFKHSEVDNYLTRSLDQVVRSTGMSGEWTGVDVMCFYSDPRYW